MTEFLHQLKQNFLARSLASRRTCRAMPMLAAASASLNASRPSGSLASASATASSVAWTAAAPLYDHDLTLPTAFLLGSEENGISPEYLKIATAKLKIPMLGKIDSLNVSVSAAVIIYEAVRQRGLK